MHRSLFLLWLRLPGGRNRLLVRLNAPEQNLPASRASADAPGIRGNGQEPSKLSPPTQAALSADTGPRVVIWDPTMASRAVELGHRRDPSGLRVPSSSTEVA
jgi:hypothetical protein